jgi:catechol 2,3-dioxygenase-like lactoylglutathione lyase family enzyme
MKLMHLDHVTITSSDPERSVAFYRDVLGMVPEWEWPDEITMLRSGDSFVAIAHWARGSDPSDPPPITVDHYAFRVDPATYARARAELSAKGVEIDHESDHGNCRSLYLRDPDRHLVELVCYEITGDPRKMPRTISGP